MAKTAILVDGGFYRKRAKHLWGEKNSKERADELEAYCRAHMRAKDGGTGRQLYRIFYYDCSPVGRRSVYHPLGSVKSYAQICFWPLVEIYYRGAA